MKKVVLSGKGILTGAGSLEYLKELTGKRAVIVTGGSSMIKSGVIARAEGYLKEAGIDSYVFSGIKKNPSITQVMEGVSRLREIKPDIILAIGGGSAMDAAKAMLLFYEFEDLNFDNVLEKNQQGLIPVTRKTQLICVPSTSGTGSEVTRGTVITDEEKRLKVPIMTDCLRPDFAILDAELTLTMPKRIAAETGMDALTHAIEAYTNHNLDDFDEALCMGAIRGILKWLPVSVEEGTLESRKKVHHYQAMAGIGFANVGLGMVHGIAHSFGAAFDMAHGLTNAIILPYALSYNSRNEVVAEKLTELSCYCGCQESCHLKEENNTIQNQNANDPKAGIIDKIDDLRSRLGIPKSFQEAGITEAEYLENKELLLDHAMLGATNVNPVKISREVMEKMLDVVYYGQAIDF